VDDQQDQAPGRSHTRLPKLVRRMLVGTFLSALGNGLVLPFLVVYLHQVRGMPTAVAGLVVAWQALLAFAGAPAAGALIDRIGPGPVLLASPVLMGLGTATFAFVHTPVEAFGAATLVAFGAAALWPSSTTLLARLAGEDMRQRAFGVQFMMLNLGIGLGGLVAGLVVDIHRPATFQALYLADAVTFVAFFMVVLTLSGVGGPVPRADDQPPSKPGYSALIRDRAMIRVSLVSLLMLACGYGALEVGYPAFATQYAGVDPKVVAFGYVANTAVIVAGQLFALRLVRGRSRSRLIAGVGLIWAASWILLGLAAPAGSHLVAAALVIAAPLVFAVGETIWQPVIPTLINDLAPEELRGRYNAFLSVTWNVAGVLGPALAGVLLGSGRGWVFVAVVSAGCVAGAVFAVRMRTVLTAVQDGRWDADQVAQPEVGDRSRPDR
jgi:MFS family permease